MMMVMVIMVTVMPSDIQALIWVRWVLCGYDLSSS